LLNFAPSTQAERQEEKMAQFPEPKSGSIFYQDANLYACLAFNPIVDGHTIVVWRADVEDMNDLNAKDYQHLMDTVFRIRAILMRAYHAPKVYIIYIDDNIRHVHVHLVPRTEDQEKGFKLLAHPQRESVDLSKVSELISIASEICG